MTATQSTTARAGSVLNKALPEAPHAYVDNGSLIVMTGGRYRPTDRWDALFMLMQLEGSPFPSSQERARQIKAALKETMQ